MLAAPPEASCEAYFCHPPLELELGASVALLGAFPKLMPCDNLADFDKPLNLPPVNPEPVSFVNDVLNELELVFFFMTVLPPVSWCLSRIRRALFPIHQRFVQLPASTRLQAERWHQPLGHSSAVHLRTRIASRC
jgi:hypothetical protein